jgi:hypothetical protein
LRELRYVARAAESVFVKSIPAPTLPAESQRDAARVLEMLARWDDKMQGRQTQRRSRQRSKYSARMAVYNHDVKPPHGQAPDAAPITVWARNVSALGVGFIYKGQIRAKRIVMCLDPETGGTTWMRAEIVRARQVHNDFWDYGAKFLGRATPENGHASTRGKGQ